MKNKAPNERLNWFKKNFDGKSSYKDHLIRQNFSEDLLKLNLNQQIELLKLMDKSDLQMLDTCFKEHNSKCKTLNQETNFLLELYPEASKERDEHLNSILEKYQASIQDYKNLRNNFTFMSEKYARDNSLSKATSSTLSQFIRPTKC